MKLYGLTNQSFLDAHAMRFVGNVWYVSALRGDDDNNGIAPDTAFATIGAGIAAAGVGDAIAVMAGSYSENGLDLNKDGLELWVEIGAILTPISGIALTVSGDYCKIESEGGMFLINPPAGEVGLLVTGDFCYVHDMRVFCASSADIGFDLQGNGGMVRNCGCASPLTAGFKIEGDRIKLDECYAAGEVGDSSIGYLVANSCDKAHLIDCSSQGNETAGFYVEAGCTNGVAIDCASGGGDGNRIDEDGAFTWSNYTFDDEIFATTELTGTGALTFNLFKVTGAVRVLNLRGHIEEALSANITAFGVKLWSAGGSDNITAFTRDLSAAPAGSILERNARAGVDIDYISSNSPHVDQSTNDRFYSFMCVADAGNDTYIQIGFNTTDNPCDGKIHWHCIWKPLSEDGWLEPA